MGKVSQIERHASRIKHKSEAIWFQVCSAYLNVQPEEAGVVEQAFDTVFDENNSIAASYDYICELKDQLLGDTHPRKKWDTINIRTLANIKLINKASDKLARRCDQFEEYVAEIVDSEDDKPNGENEELGTQLKKEAKDLIVLAGRVQSLAKELERVATAKAQGKLHASDDSDVDKTDSDDEERSANANTALTSRIANVDISRDAETEASKDATIDMS